MLSKSEQNRYMFLLFSDSEMGLKIFCRSYDIDSPPIYASLKEMKSLFQLCQCYSKGAYSKNISYFISLFREKILSQIRFVLHFQTAVLFVL